MNKRRRMVSLSEPYEFRAHRVHKVDALTAKSEPAGGKHVPKARSGHRIVYLFGSFYSYGGFNNGIKPQDPDMKDDPFWEQNRPLFKELWRFNTTTRQWSRLPVSRAAPSQLASHCCVLNGDQAQMLVYGGTGQQFGVKRSNFLFRLDLRTNKWSMMAKDLTPYNHEWENKGEEQQGDGSGSDSGSDSDWEYDSDDGDGGWNQDVSVSDNDNDTAQAPAIVDKFSWQDLTVSLVKHQRRHARVQRLAGRPADPQEPLALYGQSVLMHQGDFYTFGGTAGMQYTMDVHKFSMDEKRWSRVYPHSGVQQDDPDVPKARYRHEVCLHQDQVFLFGGGSVERVFGFDRINVFHLSDHKWRLVSTRPDQKTDEFPKPRRCHSLVYYEGCAYMIGGFNGTEVFGDIWRLDLETLTWWQMPDKLVVPVYFHSSAVTEDGQVYTFGGVKTGNSQERSNDVQCFWAKVPSLRSMAWEAVCHYTANIKDKQKKKLLRAGVPKDLLLKLGHN